MQQNSGGWRDLFVAAVVDPLVVRALVRRHLRTWAASLPSPRGSVLRWRVERPAHRALEALGRAVP